MSATLVGMFSDQCGHCTQFKQYQLKALESALSQQGINFWMLDSPILSVDALRPQGGPPGVRDQGVANRMFQQAVARCDGFPSFVFFSNPQATPLVYTGRNDYRAIVDWINQNRQSYSNYSGSNSIGGGVHCRGGVCRYGN